MPIPVEPLDVSRAILHPPRLPYLRRASRSKLPEIDNTQPLRASTILMVALPAGRVGWWTPLLRWRLEHHRCGLAARENPFEYASLVASKE